jgi:hypothetical protein
MTEEKLPYDSTQDTLNHIYRVQELLKQAVNNLCDRAIFHDQSKLKEPEKSAYDIVTPRLKGSTYGSGEYRASLWEIKPALQHHYAANSHHPEHYSNGVSGMSLFDLMEMVMDWRAASERHDDGDIWRSLEVNRERFGLSDQLYEIIARTFKEMGW